MKLFLRRYVGAFASIFSSWSAFSTMVLATFLYAALYPQPYLGEVVRKAPIVAVDQDGSTSSRALLRRIANTDGVRIAATVHDMHAAKDLFYKREAYGIVIIPPQFEQTLLDGHPSPIAAYGDASYFIIYSAIVSAVRDAVSTMGTEVQFARLTAAGTDATSATSLISPINITSVTLFNPEGGYNSYVVPAAFVLILQQTLLMGIGILQSGRRNRRGAEMLAEPVAYITLYLVLIFFSQEMLPRLYHIPKIGETHTLFLVALPFLTATCALGYVITRLIPWREGILFFLVVLGMPLFFLSGVSWPFEEIPPGIHALSLLFPSTTAITAIVQVNQMGADYQDVLPTVYTLLGLTVFYSLLSVGIGALKRRQ